MQPIQILEQDRASDDAHHLQARSRGTVEDTDGIDQFVARHSQHRFIDGDEKDTGPLDRHSAGIFDLHRDARGSARLHHCRCGCRGDIESPLHGGDPQQDFPGRMGGARGYTIQDGAIIRGPAGRGDDIDPQPELRNMIVGNRHLENRGVVGNLKGAEVDDPVVGDCQQAGGRGEGRDNENLCDVARGVRLSIGDEVGGLEFDVAARHDGPCAGNPAGDLTAAGSPRGIDNSGCDAVPAAGLGRELAVDRRLLGGGLAGLGVQRDFDPPAFDVPVDKTRRGHLEGPVGNRVAVEVGDHSLDVDPITGPHERTGRANTDIETGGMDQEVGCRCPPLAVHINHPRLGGHRHREMVAVAFKVDAQVMTAGGVGRPGECLGLRRDPAIVEIPPWPPDAERETAPVGRGVVPPLRGNRPVDLGVGEGTTGEVPSINRHHRRLVNEMRAGRLEACLHLELRAAKFLDPERVGVRVIVEGGRALEHNPAPAQVRPLLQLEGEIEAAEVIQSEFAAAKLVAERAIGRVGDQLPTREKLKIAIAAHVEVSNPALQVQRLAGAVHTAIIGGVPDGLIVLRPRIDGHRGDGRVRAERGNDRINKPIWPQCVARGASKAIAVADERQIPGFELDFHTGQRVAGAQVGGPHSQLAMVGDDVDADIGVLHPGDHPGSGLIAVCGRRPIIEVCDPSGPADRFNDHDHVTVLTLESTGEIDGNLRGSIVVDSGVDDHFCCQTPRYVEHSGASASPEARKEAHVRLEIARINRVEAYAKLLPLAHDDRDRLLQPERINRDETSTQGPDERARLFDFELDSLGLSQCLTEHVAHRPGDHHLVDGAAQRRTGDGQ